MTTSQGLSEADILDEGIEVLKRRLPATWSVEKAVMGHDPEPRNAIIKSPQTEMAAFVETRTELTVRDVQVLFGGPWKRWRTPNQPILVIAPYVSPKVRQMLADENVSFLDLTGNIRIAADYPGIFIEAQGAERDPTVSKPRRGLRGAKVGAAIRALVDAAPPYTGAEIARAAKINEGYTSRILDTLVDEGLIERERAGPVTAVDWQRIIHRRAQAVDLFRPDRRSTFVARQGPRRLLQQIASQQLETMPTITGSFAAVRLAPVAAPALLVMYTMKPRDLAAELELELLPADTGADTVLIRPDNGAAFERSTQEDGLIWAAPSQIAIDCLSGNGRMPAEGEAVINWMAGNENAWRFPTIAALIAASGTRT